MLNKLYNTLFIGCKKINTIQKIETDTEKYELAIIKTAINNYVEKYMQNYNIDNPDIFSQIENNFSKEYIKIFNDETKYNEYKNILFDKLIEKKKQIIESKKNNYFFCIGMRQNGKIQINKINDMTLYLNNNNILYIIEYIFNNKISERDLTIKYKKIYGDNNVIAGSNFKPFLYRDIKKV